MCRTGGRRCPSHTNPEAIAARNARRRAAYAAKKANGTATAVETPITTTFPGITPEQSAYFENTKAATSDGQLIRLYHGSSVDFTSFDNDTLGRGNDAWGNGFYFTDQEGVAQGYANDSGSDTANVKEFYLNMQNPIIVDGVEEMSLVNQYFDQKTAENVIRNHPHIYNQQDDEDNPNPLQDYCAEFWDKETHTKEEMDVMIRKVAKEHYSDPSWVDLENFYGREHGSAFLHAMHKETGHDGVIVDFKDAGKHYVAWFPEQMKLTSNTKPDNSANF